MLGENHSLVNEFPAYKQTITQLIQVNKNFAANAERYHLLDTEIRQLELNNAPIDDESLHQIKHERAMLKDLLYQAILKA